MWCFGWGFVMCATKAEPSKGLSHCFRDGEAPSILSQTQSTLTGWEMETIESRTSFESDWRAHAHVMKHINLIDSTSFLLLQIDCMPVGTAEVSSSSRRRGWLLLQLFSKTLTLAASWSYIPRVSHDAIFSKLRSADLRQNSDPAWALHTVSLCITMI